MALVLLAGTAKAGTAKAGEYRYIGPWFTTATVNSANDQPSLVAGQNDRDLGLDFTCFDRHVSLGLWKPGGSLGLAVSAATRLTVRVDSQAPVFLLGVGTAANLAEFDENVGLVMREMLAGRRADLLFVDHDGHEIRQVFRLDNANIAFADIARACPL